MTKKKRVPISMMDKTFDDLESLSKETGFTKSYIVETLLIKYLTKEFNNGKAKK